MDEPEPFHRDQCRFGYIDGVSLTQHLRMIGVPDPWNTVKWGLEDGCIINRPVTKELLKYELFYESVKG